MPASLSIARKRSVLTGACTSLRPAVSCYQPRWIQPDLPDWGAHALQEGVNADLPESLEPCVQEHVRGAAGSDRQAGIAAGGVPPPLASGPPWTRLLPRNA